MIPSEIRDSPRDSIQTRGLDSIRIERRDAGIDSDSDSREDSDDSRFRSFFLDSEYGFEVRLGIRRVHRD